MTITTATTGSTTDTRPPTPSSPSRSSRRRNATRAPDGAAPRGPAPAPLGLDEAVGRALGALHDAAPTPLPRVVTDGRVESMLREALRAHAVQAVPGRDQSAAWAAARTACAYLSAQELEDAYLALCTAVDHLRGPITGRPGTGTIAPR